MNLYQFPCGCAWPIIEENPPPDVVPFLNFDCDLAPEACPATWGLLGRGLTKGVFQLESNLGKQWTKKLKPECYEHITALGALLRPGCLRAVDEDGISMTQHYCRRKNKEADIRPYHPAIDAILWPTYNVLTYQEQAMAIAQAVAGFSLQEADVLRKAIGKKLPAEMAKCKTMFIEGVQKTGIISKEQAEEVFGWIEKSQRYSFNKSHACSYGITGYKSAYIKAHFPVAFFTSWLLNAQFKQDPLQEINELVNDAKLFDIVVEPPDLRSLEPNFQTDRKVIRFGLTDIKGVGDGQIKKLIEAVGEEPKDLGKMDWFDFLVNLSNSLSTNVVCRLIEVGALRWFSMTRSRMLAEYHAWSKLTEKEQQWVQNWHQDPSRLPSQRNLSFVLGPLARTKKEGGGAANKNRISFIQSQKQVLDNPPSAQVDTPHWIAWLEEQLLGISITCSKIDSCDQSMVNVTCKDYLAGRAGFLMFGVEVQQFREVKTKKGKSAGQKMAFLTISDSSCALEDVVCFPETWREYGGLLTHGNTVIIQGERDNKKDSNTLIVKKVWQAS